MGARRFGPDVMRFLQDDVYGDALSDIDLALDPLTGNRYSFAGGNPISFVEVDGHFFDKIKKGLKKAGGFVKKHAHTALDACGLVEGVGTACDLANAGLYAAEGKYKEAAISAAAAIPVAGAAVGAAKLGAKGAKAGSKLAKGADDAGDAGRSVARAGSCRNSFVGSTPVLLADGSEVPIAAIRVGDRVLAADPRTGAIVARAVTALIRGTGVKALVAVLVAGEAIVATANHPFWVESEGEWLDAGELEAGDVVLTAGGEGATVEAVFRYTVKHLRVFNLTVAGEHTYFADGVLVHNCSRYADEVPEGERAGLSPKKLQAIGRRGKQPRLRELAEDPKVSSADRGYIQTQMRQTARNSERYKRTGKRMKLHTPPGRALAHRYDKPARLGNDYRYSNLKDYQTNARQEVLERKLRANRMRRNR